MGSSPEMEHTILRRLKEDFVSNYNGTSALEIEIVTSSGPISVLLRNLIVWFLFPRLSDVVPLSSKFFLDYLLLTFPILLSFTVFSDSVVPFLTGLVCICCGIIIISEQVFGVQTKDKSLQSRSLMGTLSHPMAGKRPFLSHFRANVNLASCIGILAVDFQIFPRRFCKAETYGTGLMDVGVGSFLLSNALVSPEARGKSHHNRSLLQKLQMIIKTIFSTWPLVAIGAVRLFAVKATDYQEHVSEYGVHWNFFFTLAAVRVLATVVFCVFPVSCSLLLAVVTGCGYQFLLSRRGLTDTVLHGFYGNNSRNGLLDANREGVFSCAGYLAIFFVGVTLGTYLLQDNRKMFKDWSKVWMTLVIVTIMLWTTYYCSPYYIQDTSRRMANLNFVIWTLAFNFTKLTGFLTVELIWVFFQAYILRRSRCLDTEFCLLEATNRNGLFFFLFANLLTGAVNFSMNTLVAPVSVSLPVLAFYIFILCIVTSILDIYNISLKFW